jgi:hypothetical protein
VIREDELIAIHFRKIPASSAGTIVNSNQMQQMQVNYRRKSKSRKSLQVIREDELIAIHYNKMPASPAGTIVNSNQM